jgi:hypothetical protein
MQSYYGSARSNGPSWQAHQGSKHLIMSLAAANKEPTGVITEQTIQKPAQEPGG